MFLTPGARPRFCSLQLRRVSQDPPAAPSRKTRQRTRMLAFVWNCLGDASMLSPLVPYAEANAASDSATSICERRAIRVLSGMK